MDWTLFSLLPLGIAAALAPCPLATNIAAVGFISSQLESSKKSTLAALLYTLGRMSAYVAIGLLVSQGLSSAPSLSFWLQEELPIYLGPIMMLAGLIILEVIPFFSFGKKPGAKTATRLISSGGVLGAFVLGFLFALALCPPSAAVFFGTAIPLAMQGGSAGAWLGISLFGLGTALPVVAFSLILAFSAERAAKIMHAMPRIQKWMKLLTGWFFLILGAFWVITRILLV